MNNSDKYQDDFQKPTGVPINQSNVNASGYNDTYYEQSYSDNKYNEYEEPKKSFPWKIVIIIILALLFIFLFWFFLLGGGSSSGGNSQYEKLTADLCEKALEYERKKEGIIDRKTPGATAYIRVQNLVDEYLIDSKPIKDPRYKKAIFSKSEYKEYISFDSYLRLSVASNGEPYCEGFVDTSDDHNKPIISLKGTTPITIARGTNFEDPGARATDETDGDITDRIVRSGTVDISIVGEYTITYTVSDSSGNTSNITRLVIVKEYENLEITLGSHFDTITPVIELKGTNPYCMELGTKYKEPGAIANDNVDGNITNKIVVDTSDIRDYRPGNFRVTYTVSDTFGHKAIAYRSVMVKEKCSNEVVINNPINTRPVVSVIGKTSITIGLGEVYEDLGATAWDKEDGNITHLVHTNNTVNTRVASVYTVTYTVVDSGGLRATAKRTVTVLDPNANSNVATFVGGCPGNIRIPLGKEEAISAPTAKDNNGNAVAVRTILKDSSGAVVNQINYYRASTYTTEYYAKPNNGVEQQCIRTVTIYDDVAPKLTLPDKIFIPIKKDNCDITIADLKSVGMTVSDAPNEVAPKVEIVGGTNKTCKLDSNGFEITVIATDGSGNKTEKKTKVFIVDATDGGNPTSVVIGNCGTNGESLMYIGDKLPLEPQVYPINANNHKVTWASMSPQYATVDANGEVTAIAKGSTDVTVTTVSGEHKATCKIVVMERVEIISVSGVNIAGCESGSINMKKGTTKSLSATVTPSNASNKKVNWTSSYLSTATISASGVVTAVVAGESIIKVTTQDGNKTKDCKIVVVDANAGDTTPPSKVIVTQHSANATDPYNKSANWMGGDKGKELKIKIESTDKESKISKFEMYNSAGKLLQTILPEVSSPNVGIAVIKTDINEIVTFAAFNEVGLGGAKSDAVTAKLDNTQPKISFTAWIEDPNKWVSQPSVVVKYTADDMGGSGVAKYHYTHDDVKAKAATTINFTDADKAVELTFQESNLNKFVYVRAVDALGNIGPWTDKPSYLNMDTVAPLPPTLTVTNNNTTTVSVGFKFTDGNSPKMSGFGKFEYFINSNSGVIKTNETSLEEFTTAGQYTMKAWSYDKAGNKSATHGETKFTVAQKSSPEPTKPTSPKPTPTDPTLSATCPTVNVGNTGTVSVTQTGFKTVTYTGYSIDDHYIASIVKPADKSLSTTVTGVKTGTTKVTITVKGIPNGGTTEVSKYTTCIVTVTQPTPVTVSRYRYGMTNNYTGSNAYSDWIYTSEANAKAACEATSKAKERVASGTCGYLVSSTTKYRYIFTNSDGTKKYSGYSYATSNDATNACKAANPIAFSNPSLCTTSSNTTNRYAYVYTDTFTKAKQTSGYDYPTSSIAMDSCRGKITQVPTVTCWGDRNPRTMYQ